MIPAIAGIFTQKTAVECVLWASTVKEMVKTACTLHLWYLFLQKETHNKQWTLQISKWLSIYWLNFSQVMWAYWGSSITFGEKEQERTQVRLNLWELLNSLLSLSKCLCYSNVSFLIFKVILTISLLSSCWNSAMWLKSVGNVNYRCCYLT